MPSWFIVKGGNCIHVAANVRISTAEGTYIDSVCQILTAQYEDTKNKPIRIGICVAGDASFPTATQTRMGILTALGDYLKDSEKIKYPFQSGEEIIEHFFPIIKEKYGLEALNHIATNNFIGVGASIGDTLEIAGLVGNDIKSFSDYLETEMLSSKKPN